MTFTLLYVVQTCHMTTNNTILCFIKIFSNLPAY